MTRNRLNGAAALALGAMLGTVTTAEGAPPGPRDPDWPCQQIKVSQLSLAAVWPGPPLDQQHSDWRQDQQVAGLVRELAQRRIPVEQAQRTIRSYAQQSGDQKQQKLLELLAGLFTVLDEERSSVLAGLDRFGARQKELAAGIRADNEKLRTLQADPGSDTGETTQLTQRVTWEAQVFQDRRQAISYACDVPAKIEQRLFALTRTIQEALQ
jgi:hypothetical protein